MNTHYVYVTTNLKNGKQYVGDHTMTPKGYNLSPTGGMDENGGLHGEEAKLKVSKANKGKAPWNKGKYGIYSKETIEKLKLIDRANSKNPMFGKHHNENTLEKLKNATLKVPKMECEYCHKEIAPWMYSRYHGKKCKLFA